MLEKCEFILEQSDPLDSGYLNVCFWPKAAVQIYHFTAP